jgi:hypothetical protein
MTAVVAQAQSSRAPHPAAFDCPLLPGHSQFAHSTIVGIEIIQAVLKELRVEQACTQSALDHYADDRGSRESLRKDLDELKLVIARYEWRLMEFELRQERLN